MAFDPYAVWLRVTAPQPLTHYELLGISPAEKDVEKIRARALRLTAAVKVHRDGPHHADAVRIMGELFRASQSLTNPEKRAVYDQQIASSGLVSPLSAMDESSDSLVDFANAALAGGNAAADNGTYSLLDEVLAPPSLPPARYQIPGRPLSADYMRPPAAPKTNRRGLILGLTGACVGLTIALAIAVWFGGSGSQPKSAVTEPGAAGAELANQPDAPQPAASAGPNEIPKSGDASAPAAVPADALAKLPAKIQLPFPDYAIGGKTFPIGPLTLPAGQLPNLRIRLEQQEAELSLTQPQAEPSKKPKPPKWHLKVGQAAQGSEIYVGEIQFDAVMSELTFRWFPAAPQFFPKEPAPATLDFSIAGLNRRVDVEFLPQSTEKQPAQPPQPPANNANGNQVAAPPPLAPPLAITLSEEPIEPTPLGLPRAIDLPPLEEAGNEPFTIGTLSVETGDVTLALSDIERPDRVPWELALAAEKDTASTWQVSIAQRVSSGIAEAASIAIARLALAANSDLVFTWLPEAHKHDEAEQLRNCLITVHRGDLGQSVRLRAPQRRGAYVLNLDEERIDLPLDAKDLPADLLKIEILGHEGFPAGTTVHQAGEPKKSDPARVVVTGGPVPIEFRLRPFSNSEGHFVRIEPLAVDDIDEIAFSTGTINKMNATLQTTVAEGRRSISAMENTLRGLEGDLVRAQSIGSPSLRSSAVAKVTGQMRNLRQRGNSLSKRIARLERMLSGLPAMAQIGNQIHQRSSLRFRMFYTVGEHEVDVFRAL